MDQDARRLIDWKSSWNIAVTHGSRDWYSQRELRKESSEDGYETDNQGKIISGLTGVFRASLPQRNGCSRTYPYLVKHIGKYDRRGVESVFVVLYT